VSSPHALPWQLRCCLCGSGVGASCT